jgi:hypothetical protein
MTIVKPRKRFESTPWMRKRPVERPKRARKRPLAARDGRYPQYESDIGHVPSLQWSR